MTMHAKAGLALDQPQRRFLPLGDGDWRGGSASFRLKVDGKVQNYLSVKLWGGDVSANQATLYCDGKQPRPNTREPSVYGMRLA